MVTVVQDPHLRTEQNSGGACSPNKPNPGAGYNGYIEPDTKIPPKAKPVLSEISVNGFAIAEEKILAEAQQHPADNPGMALQAAARALVVRELLLQEARSLKLEAEPEETEQGIETEEDALIRTLIDSQVASPTSDQETRKRYYDQYKSKFASETIYEARHILLGARNNDELASAKLQADSILQKLQKNPSQFAKFAKEFSECPSRSEGGNLGQLTRGSTVREFEAVLEQMEEGQIWPEPVESRFGCHLIHLVNKVPGEVLPFEYVEDRIGAWLEASAWSKAVSQFINILAGKADITGIELEGATSPLVQ